LPQALISSGAGGAAGSGEARASRLSGGVVAEDGERLGAVGACRLECRVGGR
jgi:hypothetical protein